MSDCWLDWDDDTTIDLRFELSSSPQIMEMSMQHYPEVLQLWRETEGVMLTDADTPQRAPAYFARNPGLSQVAIVDRSVIGAALCGHDGRRGYLHHLAVATPYRRQGIARQIVHVCLDRLKRQGITACNLFVVNDNELAKTFWKRNDWSEWPELRIMTCTL